MLSIWERMFPGRNWPVEATEGLLGTGGEHNQTVKSKAEINGNSVNIIKLNLPKSKAEGKPYLCICIFVILQIKHVVQNLAQWLSM